MHRVAGCPVYYRAIGDVFTIVDHDSPNIDETEQDNIGCLLQREDEREEVVGNTLGPAINGVERVGRKGTRHNPLVVRLVQGLIDEGMMQAAVDPVDKEIGKGDEQRELQNTVIGERFLIERIVKLCVTPNLSY